MATESAIGRDLVLVVGAENVLEPPAARFLHDETETRGLAGKATAVVFPGGRDEVAEVVAWCYEREIPIVPRGGGTGFAGGAVPLAGGVVLALDRLRIVHSFDPLFWRIEVEAGLRTADLRRLVRESGLLFPPDPGAAEDSQIGGNIATNAGGPHAFKYGVTGAWVSGLEVVVPPGRARCGRWPGAQGRRRLRPEEPLNWLGRHARRDHRGVAQVDSRPGGLLPRGSLLPEHGLGLRSNRAHAGKRPSGRGARIPRRSDPRRRRRELPRGGASRRGLPRPRRGGREPGRGREPAHRGYKHSPRAPSASTPRPRPEPWRISAAGGTESRSPSRRFAEAR